MHIPYKPLSERMLQEPFWLGLITVFVVLAFIGLVWCAKRHFPEKIEKLLAEEADRNRRKCFKCDSVVISFANAFFAFELTNGLIDGFHILMFLFFFFFF